MKAITTSWRPFIISLCWQHFFFSTKISLVLLLGQNDVDVTIGEISNKTLELWQILGSVENLLVSAVSLGFIALS